MFITHSRKNYRADSDETLQQYSLYIKITYTLLFAAITNINAGGAAAKLVLDKFLSVSSVPQDIIAVETHVQFKQSIEYPKHDSNKVHSMLQHIFVLVLVNTLGLELSHFLFKQFTFVYV